MMQAPNAYLGQRSFCCPVVTKPHRAIGHDRAGFWCSECSQTHPSRRDCRRWWCSATCIASVSARSEGPRRWRGSPRRAPHTAVRILCFFVVICKRMFMLLSVHVLLQTMGGSFFVNKLILPWCETSCRCREISIGCPWIGSKYSATLRRKAYRRWQRSKLPNREYFVWGDLRKRRAALRVVEKRNKKNL